MNQLRRLMAKPPLDMMSAMTASQSEWVIIEAIQVRDAAGLRWGYKIACLGVSGCVLDKPGQYARYADAVGVMQEFLSGNVQVCPYGRANCHGARRAARCRGLAPRTVNFASTSSSSATARSSFS